MTLASIQGGLFVETWEAKARRLAVELKAMRVERDALSHTTKRWGDLSRQIARKRYEIEIHLWEVS